MTRNEAIEVVEKCIESFEGGASIYEALKMAADALKDEDAVIDRVLEITDRSTAYAKELDETFADKADGMMAATNAIRKAVLKLKGSNNG